MSVAAAPLDEKTLDRLTEDLGRARADELLRCFAAEVERRMACIEAAAGVPDLGSLFAESHALKGSAASYGALAVAREADRIAAACRAGETETALDRVAALSDLVIAAVAACKVRLAEAGGLGPGSN
jgi:HPt (histidine-containing phosphotransfer) domain-containing protein